MTLEKKLTKNTSNNNEYDFYMIYLIPRINSISLSPIWDLVQNVYFSSTMNMLRQR